MASVDLFWTAKHCPESPPWRRGDGPSARALRPWQMVFVSIHLPAGGAAVDSLDAASNDVTAQIQRNAHPSDKLIVVGDLNCEFNAASSDGCRLGSYASAARIPDARSQRIVAWMSEPGFKCASTFFPMATSRLSRLGQRDRTMDHILSAGVDVQSCSAGEVQGPRNVSDSRPLEARLNSSRAGRSRLLRRVVLRRSDDGGTFLSMRRSRRGTERGSLGKACPSPRAWTFSRMFWCSMQQECHAPADQPSATSGLKSRP